MKSSSATYRYHINLASVPSLQVYCTDGPFCIHHGQVKVNSVVLTLMSLEYVNICQFGDRDGRGCSVWCVFNRGLLNSNK